jgi:2-phosphoglycerate kinase
VKLFFIGGGSGAGKSTVARRLAERHGFRLYATDDVMTDHATRTTPADAPLLHRFMAMDMDERWATRSPSDMLATFHWYEGEGFELILEDLRRLPDGPPVIVEGFRLLPSLVQPLLSVHNHGVWLLPTPQFRRAALESRGSLWHIAARTSDPERALQNLLERDRLFTDRLREETSRLGLPRIEVTSTVDLVRRVSELFAL